MYFGLAPRFLFFLCLSCIVSPGEATSATEGDCIETNLVLRALSLSLSDSSAIACQGSPLQLYNQGRYWGEQYGKNASVVVFPTTAQDVANAILSSALSSSSEEEDLSFVSGGHGQSNASSTTGFMIDLSWMNSTQILHNVTLDDVYVSTAIAYDSGATWGQVYDVTNGSGYILVGARDSSVGVGGFSTGGGIGFLAGAYGYAIDRLRAMQVVLMSGEIVLATKTNDYSDLFWALQGGNGQFGIVTRFWQEAAPEPQTTEVGVWIVANDSSLERAYANVAEWFDCNDDPFSVVYYAVGYLPADVTSGELGVFTTMVGYRFSNPLDPAQKTFNDTFAPLIDGVDLRFTELLEVPIASAPELLTPYFPYGYRRGFWGPQTTNVTAEYIKSMSARFSKYISELLSRGESPYSATWVLQYMPPGLNGNLPSSDADTAWPHSVAGHQTLFSPAWNLSRDDPLADTTNEDLSNMTYHHQSNLTPSFLADYPNYMSPGVDAARLFGDNAARLVVVKEKYDPLCRLHQGRVFASAACVIGGWANLY